MNNLPDLYLLTKHPWSADSDGSSILFKSIFCRLEEDIDLIYLDYAKDLLPIYNVRPLLDCSSTFLKAKRWKKLARLLRVFRLVVFLRQRSFRKRQHRNTITNSIYIATFLFLLNKLGYLNSYVLLMHDCLTKYYLSMLKHERRPGQFLVLFAKLRITKVLERLIYRNAKHSIVVSSDDARVLERVAKVRPEVIELGVDLAIYHRISSYHKSRSDLLFLGNFAYPPNRFTAIRLIERILPRILSRQPDLRLLLVGKGLDTDLACRSNVTYLGYIEDTNTLYNSSAVFVCPMVGGSGMKTKMLEAMATAIPIVCNGEALKGIDHQGLLDTCIAESDEEFAIKVLEVLNDSSGKSIAIANKACEMVKDRFSWDRQARRYLAALSSCEANQLRIPF